jgi:hypothetical protein
MDELAMTGAGVIPRRVAASAMDELMTGEPDPPFSATTIDYQENAGHGLYDWRDGLANSGVAIVKPREPSLLEPDRALT